MKLRYKFRIYPDTTQQLELSKVFGCSRVVWNDALAYCIEQHQKQKKHPKNSYLQKKFITQAKKTESREWLKMVSAIPLQQSLNDLAQAYQNFFKSIKGERKGKKISPPKFKKRKSKQSIKFTRNGFKIKQDSQKIYIAKIGLIKVIWSRQLSSQPSSATIIKDSASRYFVSFVVEVNPQTLPENNNSVGIDLGITDFATLSNGEKIKSPKPLKSKLKKLRKLQKKLSRKQKGSKRRERARKKVAKLHAQITDTRTDFLHKLSTRIINENQVIILEDLNTSGMLKNRKLSRAISDLGWRTFRDMLEAKAGMYGRDLRIISRWTPTSQTCSNCGFNGGKKELNVREWICLNCGAEHDRDINAAVNIKLAGGQLESINGHGGKQKTTVKVAATDEVSTAIRHNHK